MKQREPEEGFVALRARAEQEMRHRPPDELFDLDVSRLVYELRVHQVELELQNAELLQARDETEAALARYTELYDYAPVAYFTLAHDDATIRQTNLAGAVLLEEERGQLIGKRFGVFVEQSDRAAFNAFMAQTWNERARTHYEFRLANPDTPHRHRFVRVEAVVDQTAGSINAMVLDITEKKKHELELATYRHHLEALLAQTAAARESAERANSAKSQFLANTSHELRTPLNSVMIMAQLLALNPEGTLSEKQLSHVRLIEESSADLLYLIDELLDLARIEAGKLRIVFKTVALRDALQQVERTTRELAAKKNLEFQMRIEPGVPARIRTDAARLLQVLRNLLSNAVKFTPHGTVSLHVHSEPAGAVDIGSGTDEAKPIVAFDVIDTGIGIASDDQERIFEAFVQAEGNANRSFGGAGLGLPIARQIAGLLGGHISLASTPGQGSTFTLYLPVEPALQEDQNPPPEALSSSRLPGLISGPAQVANKQVLVVDPIGRNRFALSAVLEERGLKVATAASGISASEILRTSNDIDLVLMGISAIGPDGVKWIQHLRAIPALANLPVIALISDRRTSGQGAYLAAGFSDCIVLPQENADLVALVERWLMLPTKRTHPATER